MSERRKNSRTRCRLSCQIRRGRDRIKARVLDVSEGGLCVLSPVELKKGQSLQLAVDVPKLGPAKIESTVWHVRSVKSPSTRKRAWMAGMVVVKSDETYACLLAPAELNVSVEDDSDDSSEELRMFRVRVQIEGERRTRLLTLGAATKKEAHELALADLDDSWTILEIQTV